MGYGWEARLAHVLAGFIAGFLVMYDFKLTVFLTIMFIIYELWEAIRIGDTGYLELREFIIGLYAGILLWLAIFTYAMATHKAHYTMIFHVNVGPAG